MIRLPTQAIKEANLTKAASKSDDRFIFDDKIVNRKTEPLLFNLQNANIAMQASKGDYSIRKARKQLPPLHTNDLKVLSNKIMLEMNVVIDNTPLNFSLLECNKIEKLDDNPNIFDRVAIDDLENREITVDNYFPDKNDPINQLDDENDKPQQYSKNTIQGKVEYANIDLTKINQSPKYYGKNKYYAPPPVQASKNNPYTKSTGQIK